MYTYMKISNVPVTLVGSSTFCLLRSAITQNAADVKAFLLVEACQQNQNNGQHGI